MMLHNKIIVRMLYEYIIVCMLYESYRFSLLHRGFTVYVYVCNVELKTVYVYVWCAVHICVPLRV